MKNYFSENKKFKFLKASVFFLVVFATIFFGNISKVEAAARTASVSGNWSSTATWGGSAVPVAGDTCTINNGINVTVDMSAVCTSLTWAGTVNTPTAITISGTNSLTISGATTLSRPNNGGTKTINVGAGTFNTGTLVLGGTTGNSRLTTINISTGAVHISGATFSTAGVDSQLIFSGAGTLTTAGTFMSGTKGTFTPSTGTIIYDGAGAQSISPFTYTFNNVTLTGSGAKTTTNATVNGILSMEGTATTLGTPTYGASSTLQYNKPAPFTAGAEWVTTFSGSGGIVIANTGAITMNGAEVLDVSDPLTINSGATLITNGFSLTFGGDFHNNGGTFTAGASPIVIAGTATTQSIDGFTTTGTVSMTKTAGTATLMGNVNGGALTMNGNGGTLNLGTGLTHTFTGTWTRTNGTLNGGSSTLNLGAGFSGTGGAFTGNNGTVNWTSSSAQTIAAVAYYNLILSGSNPKSITTGTSIAGDLSIAPTGSATASIGAGLNISAGSLHLGGVDQVAGTWGSTASAATNKNNTYFALTTGIVTVTTGGNLVPTTTSISPSSKTAGDAGFTMTVVGTNFIASSTVNFNGSARVTTYASSTQLTVAILTSDLITAGTSSITVFNPAPGGGTSNAQVFTVNVANNPVPTTTSISPSSKIVGDATFTLTVNGTNFIAGSVVNFNGSARTTTFVSATQLTASIPASDLLVTGTSSITVFNPTPGGGTSNSQTFSVNNPTPTTTYISPNTKMIGDSAFTMTVMGTNFLSGAVVKFNGSARTTAFISSTQLTASILASDLLAAGTYLVVVTNPAPSGGDSNSQIFTVHNTIPSITSISPASQPVGASQFTMTINGTNFVSNSQVNFNSSARTTTFVNSTQLTVVIPATDMVTAGTYSIIVNNPTTGEISNVASFTVGALGRHEYNYSKTFYGSASLRRR